VIVVVGRGRVAGEVLARLPGASAIAVGEPMPVDAELVVLCGGPLARTAAPTLAAALDAGAHYVDVGGEQAAIHAIHVDHEAAARRAGRVVLPGMGVDCALGDLAAAWAASAVAGEPLVGELVRAAPAARVAEARPLEAVLVTYVYEELVMSAGRQRALFAGTGVRPLTWRRDRWEPARFTRRRINVGGRERDAIALPAGDAITVPRHVATNEVTTYASVTQGALATGALRWAARALALLPTSAAERLAPYAGSDDDPSRTRFWVVAEARRDFAEARVVIAGRDPYRTTAAIAAWAARQVFIRDRSGPLGVRAPSELFRADLALAALAEDAGLVVAGP
jgi:short subunit dehydrogenase-like uncharacterized protein